MKTLFSFYNLKLPIYFVYMLQQVEYEPKKFLEWVESLVKKNKKIKTVVYRKSLVSTRKANSLIYLSYFISVLLIVLILFLNVGSTSLLIFNISVILITLPYLLILELTLLSYLARIFIVNPSEKKLIKMGQKIFTNSKSTKIAIVGSYGKTTMKELLYTILSENFNVAITPGNMNTLVSQSRFAKKLTGDEEIIIVEFGEGEPGDVSRMTDNLKPDYVVITGLAPNHLDKYKSLNDIAIDLLSVYKYIDNEKVFVSAESSMLKPYIKSKMQVFSKLKVMGWSISKISVSLHGTSFVMKKSTKVLNISTKLLGRHQVAPVALGVALADSLGLSINQIEQAVLKIEPHEHRMQARNIHGAWLIDDTYNGNFEGLQAGLRLLSELDMKRKWYVTPGLVDQGEENERVHTELGKSIAEAQPDVVVLMENSARPIIEKSMIVNNFKGELKVETDPLQFYTNIEHVVASGDLVLLQNDWTDNYN